MSSPTTKADEIQNRMRSMRYELGDDVQGVVENVRLIADWRYYVRTYPWVCLSVAAAAGFLIVPSSQSVWSDRPSPADSDQGQPNSTPVRPSLGGRISSRLMNAAAGMLLQGGLAVASSQLNQFLQGWQRKPDAPGNGELGGSHEEPHR